MCIRDRNLVVLGQSLLRFIHKGWGRFYHHFSSKVGVDSSIFFWHDSWCEEGPLQDLFPSLYVLVMNRDATIVDSCQSAFGAVVWSPIFIRDALVNDTILASFLNKLNGIAPQDSTDAVSWGSQF